MKLNAQAFERIKQGKKIKESKLELVTQLDF